MILSIDVGINNLAYCLVDNEKNIVKWDNINIKCEEEEIQESCLCSILQKNNKICGKKAKFKKNDNLFCLQHSKKSEYINIDSSLNKLKNSIKKTLIDFCENNNLDISDKTTKKEILDIIILFFERRVLDELESKKKVKKIPQMEQLVIMSRNIKKQLNLHFSQLSEIKYVIIENQMYRTMSQIMTMICQHFITSSNHDILIEFVSPTYKLQNYKSLSYSERKNKSIELCLEHLKENQTDFVFWSDYLNKYVKKDDMCDSYLQCFWYLDNKINIK